MFHRIVGLVALLCLLTALTVAPQVPGQTAERTAVQDLDRRMLAFFGSLNTKAPKAGFDSIVKGGPLETNKGLEKILQQVQAFDGKYGAFVEAELIRGTKVGKDLVILNYLYKSQKFPLVWRFVFYRTPTTVAATTPRPWHLVAVSFHTKLEQLDRLKVVQQKNGT